MKKSFFHGSKEKYKVLELECNENGVFFSLVESKGSRFDGQSTKYNKITMKLDEKEVALLIFILEQALQKMIK